MSQEHAILFLFKTHFFFGFNEFALIVHAHVILILNYFLFVSLSYRRRGATHASSGVR